jgi:hypothetical protein
LNIPEKHKLYRVVYVQNQTRRRTPGGVFLYYVKSESTQEESQQIFLEDRRQFDAHRRLERSKLRRKRAKETQRTLQEGMHS